MMNAGQENNGRPAMLSGYAQTLIQVSIKNAVVTPMIPPIRQTSGTRVLWKCSASAASSTGYGV